MEYLLAILLVTASAGFSGLTLAYFSLNVGTLRRRAKLGDKEALVVYPIRQRGNQLLTTLLLGNVAVNTILSIYLGSIASGITASIIATTLIFLFGEIIPQAAFSRHALYVGKVFAPLIKVLLFIFSPLTYPIAKILDWFLGEEMPTLYSRHELMEIVSELEDSSQSVIDADEERIVHGALMFSHTTVREVMTPSEKVISFDENQRLTRDFILTLGNHGYSRYPIYSGNPENVVAILYVKDLLSESPDTQLKHMDDAIETNILKVRPNTTLDQVLGQMLKRRQHLAVVTNKKHAFLGVISLEDIIEEIIQQEINDEDDEDDE
jgi:metal transporter CNNM